jgi:class 3 adenylate cyclase
LVIAPGTQDRGSQILVSGEVLAAAGELPGVGQALGSVHVKGREAPIEIYRLA